MNVHFWFLCCTLLCFSESSNTNKQIIGGRPQHIGYVPFLAHLEYLGFVCSATIIGELWVVTAGFCSNWHKTPEDWILVAGTGRLDYVGMRHRVIRWERHPRYEWNLQDYDIALVNVASPMLWDGIVMALWLPEQDEPTPANGDGLITGWGMVYPSVAEMSNKVHAAWIETYSDEGCKEALGNLYTPRKMCAMQKRGQISVSTNDLGGPLAVGHTLYGIILPKLNDLYQDINGVKQFARVSSVRNWIRDVTGL